jgi:hypothetical protein
MRGSTKVLSPNAAFGASSTHQDADIEDLSRDTDAIAEQISRLTREQYNTKATLLLNRFVEGRASNEDAILVNKLVTAFIRDIERLNHGTPLEDLRFLRPVLVSQLLGLQGKDPRLNETIGRLRFVLQTQTQWAPESALLSALNDLRTDEVLARRIATETASI